MTATRAEVLAKLASLDHQLPMPASVSFVNEKLLTFFVDSIADVKAWAEWGGQPVDEYYRKGFSHRQAEARFELLGFSVMTLASEKLTDEEQAALVDEDERLKADDHSTTMHVNPDGSTEVVAIPQRAEQ